MGLKKGLNESSFSRELGVFGSSSSGSSFTRGEIAAFVLGSLFLAIMVIAASSIRYFRILHLKIRNNTTTNDCSAQEVIESPTIKSQGVVERQTN